MHDWSKFSPTEFWESVKYFDGHKSPITVCKADKGYSEAWLHHKGRNKHHLEYWIDYSLTPGVGIEGMEMPVKYVVEMFCDRVAACKNYHPKDYTDDSALKYYEKGKNKYPIHPNTRALLEKLLHMLAEEGEDATFAYIRTEVLHNTREERKKQKQMRKKR